MTRITFPFETDRETYKKYPCFVGDKRTLKIEGKSKEGYVETVNDYGYKTVRIGVSVDIARLIQSGIV